LLKLVRHWHPTQWVALFIWATALVGISARVALSDPTSHSVVPIYAAAAERWLAHEDCYCRGPAAQGLDVFRNPPAFAAAFVPFAMLPHPLMGLCWRAVSVAVLLTGIGVWARHVLVLDRARQGLVYLLSFPLLMQCVNNGQANILIIGLLLHAAAAVTLCSGVRAGAFLGLAAMIKVYPISVGLLCSTAFPRRVLPWFLLALALLAIGPFLAAPPETVIDQYRNFYHASLEDRRAPHSCARPVDFFLVLEKYARAPSTHEYTLLVLTIAAAMAAMVAATAYRLRSPLVSVVLAIDLGCIWMTVFGPAAEPVTYSLLAPTAAAAVVLRDASSWRFAVASLGYLLLVLPVLRDFLPESGPFHKLGLQPIGGLLLLLAIVGGWITEVCRSVSDRGPGASAGTLHGIQVK
jgi:hypothetical protein